MDGGPGSDHGSDASGPVGHIRPVPLTSARGAPYAAAQVLHLRRPQASRHETHGWLSTPVAWCSDRQSGHDLVRLSVKSNSVAVLTDGTAVLGLGNIGPAAAMPVMEGKAMLFRQLAGVDAYPICTRTSGVEELIAVGKAIAPSFGGINPEDVAAPECFEVERRLQHALDISVVHDDQHATAIVTLAARYGAAEVVGKRLEDLKVVFLGMGAAGVACVRLWQHAGVRHFVGVDRHGIISTHRTDLNSERRSIAETTNPERLRGELKDALAGADVFVGLSGPA